MVIEMSERLVYEKDGEEIASLEYKDCDVCGTKNVKHYNGDCQECINNRIRAVVSAVHTPIGK